MHEIVLLVVKAAALECFCGNSKRALMDFIFIKRNLTNSQ